MFNELIGISADQLTTHALPALLIDTVTSLHADNGSVCTLARENWDSLQIIEACAQSVAVITGALYRCQAHSEPADGMLVGAKGFCLTRPIYGTQILYIHVHRQHRLGALEIWDTHIYSDQEHSDLLASGDLKLAQTQRSEEVRI